MAIHLLVSVIVVGLDGFHELSKCTFVLTRKKKKKKREKRWSMHYRHLYKDKFSCLKKFTSNLYILWSLIKESTAIENNPSQFEDVN